MIDTRVEFLRRIEFSGGSKVPLYPLVIAVWPLVDIKVPKFNSKYLYASLVQWIANLFFSCTSVYKRSNIDLCVLLILFRNLFFFCFILSMEKQVNSRQSYGVYKQSLVLLILKFNIILIQTTQTHMVFGCNLYKLRNRTKKM